MFSLDALPSWEPLLPKEAIIFQAAQPRRVRLSFNVNGPVEVWATYQVDPFHSTADGNLVENPDPETRDVLVAAFDRGCHDVQFTTFGQTIVRALSDDETVLFVRHYTADHTVAPSDDPSYTTPFPRERRNTEFDRMVMWAKLNEARREKQFAEALASIQAQGQAPAPNEDQAQPGGGAANE